MVKLFDTGITGSNFEIESIFNEWRVESGAIAS